MADRIESFQITVASGVAKAAPVETSTSFPPGVVSGITIVLPAAADAGLQIAYAHQPIIPRLAGQFVQSQSQSQSLPFTTTGLPNAGAWSVFAYNATGASVAFQVIFSVFEIAPGAQYDFTPPLPAALIYGPPVPRREPRRARA